MEPPPSFVPIVYDVPPPPPAEIVYVDRPLLVFSDPVFGFVPPPPIVFLAPPPAYLVIPPPPPDGLFLLPVPVFVPVPVWINPPAYVVAPPVGQALPGANGKPLPGGGAQHRRTKHPRVMPYPAARGFPQ